MSAVPCNGCTLCCRQDVIALFPEHGDDIAAYETQEWTIPGSGITVTTLKKQDDGLSCIYLAEHGCTIYDRRPSLCRAFDCRRWFLSKTRQERRSMVSRGIADKAIFDRGRELLPTLQESPHHAPLIHKPLSH